MEMGRGRGVSLGLIGAVLLLALSACEGKEGLTVRRRNAYATMMYMGTPRDYEFYVATRVMFRSLARLRVDADLVVIASMDVPLRWIQALEEEDGAKIMRVENLKNPYVTDPNSPWRFKLTLNKLYSWKLVEYDRVVMLDADNLFLENTDELFQCGQFCAVFINPCIFHTGLFVLQPSMEVFNDMMHDLEIGRSNPDGADQGFIGNYYPDLLDKPMFHPPSNGTKLDGQYRLPLGYQMDASYYYLKLRWNVPCGPNSVITFPSAPWMKPWYWWSWPVLPLGIEWHKHRLQTLGYAAEMPIAWIQAIFYVAIIAVSRLARPNLTKLCYRREGKSTFLVQTGFKLIAIWSILAAYIVPFFLVPRTIHPVVGWGLYLLGSFSLSSIAINAFLLPMLPVLTLWFGILGTLLVMGYPWYHDGIIRALSVFAYAFCCSPLLFISFGKIMSALQVSVDREVFLPRLGESATLPEFNKLY
ncbi:putative glucuronosyltransferase PGSIP8 [Andrographis paniculata]|uniref:putative glucuronosyltransferase PGSIP8 n=1 Tax=Andrographis paniculata TaxID=175694 RepID=UPI0021E752D7|nr:putative glucuronosyltransferase PGSIP8 [Andrographis paniculata]